MPAESSERSANIKKVQIQETSTWFGEGDYAALAKLFSRLLNRVARVESLLSYHLSGLIVKRDEAIKAEAADPVLSASPPDSCAPTLVLGPETF